MKALLIILMLAAVSGVSSAGTVTLAGTCSQSLINSSVNYTTFTLSNLGNQTATDLLVIPSFGGGTVTNATQSVPLLQPGQNITIRFYFNNFSTPGSYSGSYSVTYSQGTATFFTIFPCILDFGSQATSLLRVYNISESGSSLNVYVINLGQDAVYANVTVLLPQSFSLSPRNTTVYLGPSSSSEVHFTISHPSVSGALYGIAAVASYTSSGLHYSSLQAYTLNFPATGSGIGGSSLLSQYGLYIVIAVVILALVCLIIFAAVRKRRSKGKSAE